MSNFVGYTSSSEAVWDRRRAAVTEGDTASSQLPSIVGKLAPEGVDWVGHVTLPTPAGIAKVMPVTGGVIPFMARLNGGHFGPFIHAPPPTAAHFTSDLTVVLKKEGDRSWLVVTTYFGCPTPPFPDDARGLAAYGKRVRNPRNRALEFWQRHALRWGSVPAKCVKCGDWIHQIQSPMVEGKYAVCNNTACS